MADVKNNNHEPAWVVTVDDLPDAIVNGPTVIHDLEPFEITIKFNRSIIALNKDISFNDDEVIVCNGSVESVSGSYPNYSLTIVPDGKGAVGVTFESADIRNATQNLRKKLKTYCEAESARENAGPELQNQAIVAHNVRRTEEIAAKLREKTADRDEALQEFCTQYGYLNINLREYVEKVVKSFEDNDGLRSIELVTGHGNVVVLEDGFESLSTLLALRRIRSFSLENKVNALLDHASVARAAEERETVKYQQVGDDLFHRLWEHARNHIEEIKKDRTFFQKHIAQFNRLKKIIEYEEFREVWEKGKELLLVEPHVTDPKCHLSEINTALEEIRCFFDGGEKQLSELKERVCGQRMRDLYQGLTSNVAKDFDRSWFGRYQWIGPVAIGITAITAAILVVWPSPFLLSWGIGILSATFVLSLIGSAWAGHQKRNSIMKCIRSELDCVLRAIFPAEQSAVDGDRRFAFPRLKKPYGSSRKDWEKGLQAGKINKFGVGDFNSKTIKSSKRRMWAFNCALLIIPATVLFISCSDQNHNQYYLYGLFDGSKFSRLAQGKIVHTNEDWIYVDEEDNWLPTALPRDSVLHISQTEIAEAPREPSLKIGMQEKTERFIDKLFTKQKQAPQILIVNPTMSGIQTRVEITEKRVEITEKNVQKILEAIQKTGLKTDQFNDLISALKDIAASGKQSKTTVPVILNLTDNRGPGQALFTIVLIDGKRLSKFEEHNALLMAVFDRDVSGIGLKDNNGKDWDPFESDSGAKKKNGIGNPDEAFLFGLASLHSYTPDGATFYSPPLDYLRHVSNFIARCAVNGPVELSVEGFASDKWQGPLDYIGNDRQYTPDDMNAALAEGRRLAAIAQILKQLRQEKFGGQIENVNFESRIDGYADNLVNALIETENFHDLVERLKDEVKLKLLNRKFATPSEMKKSRNAWVDNNSELVELMGRSFVIRFLNASDLKCGYRQQIPQ